MVPMQEVARPLCKDGERKGEDAGVSYPVKVLQLMIAFFLFFNCNHNLSLT